MLQNGTLLASQFLHPCLFVFSKVLLFNPSDTNLSVLFYKSLVFLLPIWNGQFHMIPHKTTPESGMVKLIYMSSWKIWLVNIVPACRAGWWATAVSIALLRILQYRWMICVINHYIILTDVGKVIFVFYFQWKKSVYDFEVILGSVTNKNVSLHLENMICRPGQLCSTAVFSLTLKWCDTFYLYQTITAPAIWKLYLAIVILIICYSCLFSPTVHH